MARKKSEYSNKFHIKFQHFINAEHEITSVFHSLKSVEMVGFFEYSYIDHVL